MTMQLTGALMRKVVEFHKTTRKCCEGVAFNDDGRTRMLGPGDVPKSDERAEWFARCPVCGKECAKHPN